MSISTYRVYASCRLNTLPVDVLDYIWNMNHVWAANIIQIHFKSYVHKRILDKVREDSGLGYKMQNYSLFYKDRVYKKRDVFATCKACKCCGRHQINKPKNMGPKEALPFHGTQNTTCDCSCRHMARFLCED